MCPCCLFVLFVCLSCLFVCLVCLFVLLFVCLVVCLSCLFCAYTAKKGNGHNILFLSFEMRHINRSCCSIVTSVAWTPHMQWLPKHTTVVSLLHKPLSWILNNSILSYASITAQVCGGELLLITIAQSHKLRSHFSSTSY